MSAYSEKLRDPRWQRKRLEIMQRDRFTCRVCSATDKTLNVHHLVYRQDREPWDYDDRALLTLCEDCHTEEHNERRDCEALVIDSLRMAGATSGVLATIACLLDIALGSKQPRIRQLDKDDWLVVAEAFSAVFRAAHARRLDGLVDHIDAHTNHAPEEGNTAP